MRLPDMEQYPGGIGARFMGASQCNGERLPQIRDRRVARLSICHLCPEEDFTVGTKTAGFLRFPEKSSGLLC